MAAKKEQPLLLNPCDKISFRPPFDTVSTSKITLKNPTEGLISYKIKTTAPKRYCVRPNFGIVKPGEEEEVVVMLQPGPTNERHKFQIQSIRVPMSFGELPKDNQMKEWGNAEYLPSADTKLTCDFVIIDEESPKSSVASEAEAPNWEEPVSLGSIQISRPSPKIESVPEESVRQHQQTIPDPVQKSVQKSSITSSPSKEAEEIRRLKALLADAESKIRTLSSTAPDAIEPDSEQAKKMIIYCFIAFMIGFFIACVI